MDSRNFGLTGLGHIDYTARCCRAGLNKLDIPLDVRGSNDYIRLQQGNSYIPAIPMSLRDRENNSEVLKRKRQLIRTSNRIKIQYNETNMRRK